MAVQTTYNDRMPKAVAGMIANMESWNADTRIVETAAGIGFGLAVGRGSADKGAVIGGASAAAFLGISIRDVTQEPHATLTDKYPQYKNMAVLKRGVIWVTAAGDVQDGQDVSFNSTTGALSSAAGSGTQFAIPGARWLDTVSSGALARIELTGQMTGA